LPGVKPGICFSLLALIEQGDKVIHPDPGYPTYHSLISYIGAKPIPIYLREANNFGMKVEDIASKLSPRTKLIIINSPHNPTGSVYEKKDLEEISELARKQGVWILSDDIYSQLVYDQKHFSISEVDESKERTILLDGFSKTYAITGWRLGWAIAPKKLIERKGLLALNAISCTTSFVQKVGIRALKDPAVKVEVKQMVNKFRQRREAIVKGLNSVKGFDCLWPKGAFYAFPSIRAMGKSCEEIADYLLEELGIATLPGTGFGGGGKGFLRFSYATSLATINEAIERLKTSF
jgi:aspartate/methionine/tyrosine aminotransferase